MNQLGVKYALCGHNIYFLFFSVLFSFFFCFVFPFFFFFVSRRTVLAGPLLCKQCRDSERGMHSCQAREPAWDCLFHLGSTRNHAVVCTTGGGGRRTCLPVAAGDMTKCSLGKNGSQAQKMHHGEGYTEPLIHVYATKKNG